MRRKELRRTGWRQAGTPWNTARNWRPGDAEIVRRFAEYARGENPAGHRATGRIPVYGTWPRLEGVLAIEAYFERNADYLMTARESDDAFPFTGGFERSYGVFNLYADEIHFNDTPHNGEEDGTLGAWIAALAIYAGVTGGDPREFGAGGFARLDPEADAALLAEVAEVVWDVVRNHGLVGLSQGIAFAAWAEQALAGDRASARRSASDPDGDGRPNLLEAWLGSDPLEVDGALDLLAEPGSETAVALRFRPVLESRLLVEASADLETRDTVVWDSNDVSPDTRVCRIGWDALDGYEAAVYLRLRAVAAGVR